MQDIGYQCCQTAANLKELLKKFPDANEADVAAILAMMLRTSAEGEEGSSEPSSWNLGVFVDTIKELVRSPRPPLFLHIDTSGVTRAPPPALACSTPS
jgi:hypothetical protein